MSFVTTMLVSKMKRAQLLTLYAKLATSPSPVATTAPKPCEISLTWATPPSPDRLGSRAAASVAQGPSTTAPAKVVAEAEAADRLGLNLAWPIFALGQAGKTRLVTG